jgi:hypothetical protein
MDSMDSMDSMDKVDRVDSRRAVLSVRAAHDNLCQSHR